MECISWVWIRSVMSAQLRWEQIINILSGWRFTCVRCRSGGSLPALDLCYSNTEYKHQLWWCVYDAMGCTAAIPMGNHIREHPNGIVTSECHGKPVWEKMLIKNQFLKISQTFWPSENHKQISIAAFTHKTHYVNPLCIKLLDSLL